MGLLFSFPAFWRKREEVGVFLTIYGWRSNIFGWLVKRGLDCPRFTEVVQEYVEEMKKLFHITRFLSFFKELIKK